MPTELHGTFYTVQEAADRLGYASPATIRMGCTQGTIIAHKMGKTWLIEEKEVERLASQEQKPQGNRGAARK